MELLNEWVKEFQAAITVCDQDGIITEMNDKSLAVYKDDGGEKLIGTNLLNCHPEPAKTQLYKMLKEGITNSYTIEKNGKKKMIYQSPYFVDSVYSGFIEISIEIPFKMPHFLR
jgi:transcriptional regulator with PAS, ATPase and Fis domain